MARNWVVVGEYRGLIVIAKDGEDKRILLELERRAVHPGYRRIGTVEVVILVIAGNFGNFGHGNYITRLAKICM